MQRVPPIAVKVLVLLMLAMLPLRSSLGAGYQLMFMVQHEPALAHHSGEPEEQVSFSDLVDGHAAPASHVCCFQFTMSAALHAPVFGNALGAVLHTGQRWPAIGFVPAPPRKPPKRG